MSPLPRDPLLGRRDINLIDIHSEPYPSVSTIPNRCLARWDVRFLPGETKQGLLDEFAAAVADGRAAVGPPFSAAIFLAARAP